MERFLTVQEVASTLNIHQQTVWKMIKDGRLPAFRLTSAPKSPYRVRGSELSKLTRSKQ